MGTYTSGPFSVISGVLDVHGAAVEVAAQKIVEYENFVNSYTCSSLTSSEQSYRGLLTDIGQS